MKKSIKLKEFIIKSARENKNRKKKEATDVGLCSNTQKGQAHCSKAVCSAAAVSPAVAAAESLSWSD